VPILNVSRFFLLSLSDQDELSFKVIELKTGQLFCLILNGLVYDFAIHNKVLADITLWRGSMYLSSCSSDEMPE
jgi:hypothetical protein